MRWLLWVVYSNLSLVLNLNPFHWRLRINFSKIPPHMTVIEAHVLPLSIVLILDTGE